MSVLADLSRKLRAPFNRQDAVRRLVEYHAYERSLEEVVDWAMHFGGSGHYRIKTLQLPAEILRLAQRVKELEPKLILEIGTGRAGPLLIWSSLASEEVITCDLRDLETAADLFTQLPPPKSVCRVTLLSGNSHDAEFRARVERAVDGRQVDFLFINGDRSEAGVEADYEDYRHFVRPGGLIAFSDIVATQPVASTRVHPFWERLKQGKEHEEIIADPDQVGFGIGVLRNV